MPDEKDRLGDKLRDVEKAREDQYFAQRDQELLAKLKAQKASEQEQTLKELAHMRCPKCGEHLHAKTLRQVTVEECPTCHGVWLDKGELEHLAQDGDTSGWLSRFLGLGR
jgi:acetyl-CoA carboxylase beta subunit